MLSLLQEWNDKLLREVAQRRVSAAGRGFGGKNKKRTYFRNRIPSGEGAAPASPLQTMLGVSNRYKQRLVRKINLSISF
jgi:hypothetical protein